MTQTDNVKESLIQQFKHYFCMNFGKQNELGIDLVKNFRAILIEIFIIFVWKC